MNIFHPIFPLNELWQSAPINQETFVPERYFKLPVAARRYLEHAIAPGTKLASAVRLKMHGEIKLKKWYPFNAEQVICLNRGMLWQATTWMNGIPIWGWDRFLKGEGAMKWKLLGLLPIFKAHGTDISKSAIGRMHGECIWLPSTFCPTRNCSPKNRHVRWTAPDENHAQAHLTLQGHATDIYFAFHEEGQLKSFSFKRWGNPEGQAYHYVNFGGLVHTEKRFEGFTIPTHLQVGWYFHQNSSSEKQCDRFESEGEFFRVMIDHAQYR